MPSPVPDTETAAPPGVAGCERRDMPSGSAWVRVTRFDPSVVRGGRTLGACRDADPGDVAVLCGSFDRTDPGRPDGFPPLDRPVFLDTETTGLQGGAGTYVFLLGAASFVGGAFEVRQWLLPGPAQEAPFLDALDAEAAAAGAVVTFHGRGFDLPRLEERCLLARRRFPLASTPHVDLLLGARRVLRLRAARTTLGELERSILGVERTDDLPGRDCPDAWLRFVRGDPSRIGRVLEHNLLDLLSLPALLVALADAARGAAPAPDLHLAGKVMARAGRAERALGLQRTATRTAGDGALAALAHEEAARLLRRAGATAEAAAEAAAATLADPGLPGPWIALAKHAEHVTADFELALACARRAERCLFLRGRSSSVRRETDRRIARLARRVGARPGAAPPELRTGP